MTIAIQDNSKIPAVSISDLGPSFKLEPIQGFIINGQKVVMQLSGVVKDREGDVQYWLYIGVEGIHKLQIFND